jgi:hypothetical protein
MTEQTDKKSDMKAPYVAPVLVVYGSLRDLTQTNASIGGMNDRGGSVATKTG